MDNLLFREMSSMNNIIRKHEIIMYLIKSSERAFAVFTMQFMFYVENNQILNIILLAI